MTDIESVIGRFKTHQKMSKKPLRTMVVGDTHHINRIVMRLRKNHIVELIGYIGDGMALIQIEKAVNDNGKSK